MNGIYRQALYCNHKTSFLCLLLSAGFRAAINIQLESTYLDTILMSLLFSWGHIVKLKCQSPPFLSPLPLCDL